MMVVSVDRAEGPRAPGPSALSTAGHYGQDWEGRPKEIRMQTAEAVRRPGVTIEPHQTIQEAALPMERTAVGALAIVDDGHLVGIVTDRDIVRRGLAKGSPLDARIDSVMSTPVVAIAADADLRDAFALFRTNAIRRLCVVRGEEFNAPASFPCSA